MAKLVLLEGMLSSSSSDSDSDELIDSESWDDIFEDDDENHHCYPLRPIPIVDNFMENVVARYTDTEFQENFRIWCTPPKVICNEKHEFIHCYVGLPGSVHDNRVFRYSGVQQKCNDEYFPENTHLLGDKAYTLQKHLMTPFVDNGHLTVEETHYNYVHSSTRMIIEKAI
ncbi:hypothetical protein PV328_012306, partial [Microctonus aethiopoides]